MRKKTVLAYFLCFSICSLFADSSDLLAGLDAYSRSDWNVAVQSFERALTAAPDDRTEALYWLVMSETSAQNYQRALYYADAFLENASEDERAAEVSYQKGRLLHLSGDYETSSKILYQFIEDYPEHPKVPSAYYWIGENLYAAGNYTEARKVFSGIVADYPQSGKVNEARYKIVLIDQQSVREELLRMASEANAAAVPDGSSAIEEQQQNEDIINRLTALEEKLDELSATLARIAEEQEQQRIREQQQKEQEEAERQQLEKRRQELAELKARTRTLEELYTQRVKGAK